VPSASAAEAEPIVEDLVAAGHDSPAGDDSPTEDRHAIVSNAFGKTASIATNPTEDKVARLDQAKRPIFNEVNSSFMEPVTAPNPAPVNASSPPAQDPDTEMFDDLAINTEQSEKDEMAPHQKPPMQTFGTIDGFLSSSKTAAQYGFNSDSVDPDDEAENLIHNRKPLRRTSVAPAGSALHPDISIDSAGNGKSKEKSLSSKDDSDTEGDETGATAPSTNKRKDPAKQKAYEATWRTSGARVKNELLKRLAENDGKIGGKGDVPKLWGGKNLGNDSDRKAANIRLEDVIKKQVKLHNFLCLCTDADTASDLRQKWRPWMKGGRIDEYESQLDAIFSTVQEAPSNDRVTPGQQANNDSAEDSNDDFALPALNSQQQKMADFLLSKVQPVRKATEAGSRESSSSDQQVQPSTSPTMNERDEVTLEDSDDDGLPDPKDLFPSRLPRGNYTVTQPVRDAGKSAERPQKRSRIE
jgi:hypothetical protein